MAIGFLYKCVTVDCGFLSTEYDEVKTHLEDNHDHTIKASYVWAEDPIVEE